MDVTTKARAETVRWQVQCPVNMDEWHVTAYRYTLTGTEVLTPDGHWTPVLEGAISKPSIVLPGRFVFTAMGGDGRRYPTEPDIRSWLVELCQKILETEREKVDAQ